MPSNTPLTADHSDPPPLPKSVLGWLRLWFVLEGRVGRQAYALSGVGLMLFKYLIEAGIVRSVSGLSYSPLDFANPLISIREQYFVVVSPGVALFWVIWSLVFLWIAVSMSVRRALDAGISPWHGFWVLVPLVNLLAMLTLACLPSQPAQEAADEPTYVEPSNDTSATMEAAVATIGGIAAGACYAIAIIGGMTTIFHEYGITLFFGTPFVTGMVTGYLLNRSMRSSGGTTAALAALAVLLTGAGLLLFAVEGVICLVMAAPIMLPLGVAGGLVGKFLAELGQCQDRALLGALVILPMLGGVESRLAEKSEFVVTSSIDVDAAPAEVWQHVIAFPAIDAEPEWFFRLGIAAPMGARIDGAGVGATRECIFTTGRFVEPITAWQPPSRLAFNVSEQPDPMTELSPFRHVHPPHLDGSFRATRGEFELVPLAGGGTRLVGRTWYTLDIRPLDYWTVWSDGLIHRIHLRVLRHIARLAEAGDDKAAHGGAEQKIAISP